MNEKLKGLKKQLERFGANVTITSSVVASVNGWNGDRVEFQYSAEESRSWSLMELAEGETSWQLTNVTNGNTTRYWASTEEEAMMWCTSHIIALVVGIPPLSGSGVDVAG